VSQARLHAVGFGKSSLQVSSSPEIGLAVENAPHQTVTTPIDAWRPADEHKNTAEQNSRL